MSSVLGACVRFVARLYVTCVRDLYFFCADYNFFLCGALCCRRELSCVVHLVVWLRRFEFDFVLVYLML